MIVPAGHSGSDPAALPLVGREREQAALRERLDAVLTGRGGLVLVGGEAGIGKTTLAEALLAEASGRGTLVLVGRCYDLSETPPYGPWLEAIGEYPDALGLPPVPDAVSDRGALDAVASQMALLEQVTGWLAAVAAARPLILFLDDLHWADPASLELLRVVARRASQARLLLLVGYRSDELTRRHPLYALLPVLEREAHALRLDLRPFDAQGVRDLAAARYALAGEDTARLVSWLVGRAEGNAFFTAQLLRALEDEGALGATADGWALGDLGAVGLPAPLRQVLDARLARLGEEALRLLTLAAVIGHEVPLALWATVAETDEDGLLDAVDAAEAMQLVAALPDGSAVRFAHALIREALYEGLVATRRRRIHLRAGEALAATPHSDPDAVAYHLRQAGDPRAAEWLVKAGERAQRAYAWITAAERYEAALALMERGDADARGRARLLHTLAQLRRYVAPEQGVAYLAEAVRLAEAAGDTTIAAAASFDQGHLRCLTGDTGSGLPLMLSALPKLEALTSDVLAALPTQVVLGVRPGERYHRGAVMIQLANAGRVAEVVAYGGEVHVQESPSSRALGALGVAHALRGEVALAAQRFAESRAASESAAQHQETLIGLGYETVFVAFPYQADQPAVWSRLSADRERLLPLAYPVGTIYVAHLTRLTFHLLTGRWETLKRISGGQNGIASALVAVHARWRGDRQGAWELVRTLLPGGPSTPPGARFFNVALTTQRTAAALALDAGDSTTAETWLQAHDRWLAWAGTVWGQADGELAWAEYHRATGDPAQARECVERGLARAGEPRQPLALLAAHRLLGELDTTAGRYGDAAAHLDAALTLAEACAAPFERALTLLASAELRLATGNHPGARATLTEARALLVPLEARPALARADALAARLVDVTTSPSAAATLPAGLSAREAEVLGLVAQGLSNAQAAERLFLSPRTIDQHLRTIYGKLGVENRAAATRFAVEHRLTGEAP